MPPTPAPSSPRALVRLFVRWMRAALCALTLAGCVAGCAMRAPTYDPHLPPPLPILRHAAHIRCDDLPDISSDAEGPRAPLRCAVRVEVTFSQPMDAIAAEGLDFELFYQTHRLRPSQVSRDGRAFTFTAEVTRPNIHFTDAVRDIAIVEARHPLTVRRWMAPVYPISYSARALYGAPLHLTLDLPDALSPEDLWLGLSFRGSGPNRHTLTETLSPPTYHPPTFSAPFEGPARFTPGGPLLGAGCYIRNAASDALRQCPTLIAGWEVSHPDWLLYQLAVETNFTHTLTFAPSVEAAMFIETWGPGLRLGLPIEVSPTPRVGLRALLTFSTWGVTGALGADFFPWQPHEGSTLSTVFQAHFSL